MNSLGRAATKYETNLDLALGYLASRGVSEDAARQARLGVVVEPDVGHEQMVGRLAIPYVTRAGVVDLKFRAMDDAEPKYLCIGGLQGSRLYNVGAFFLDSDVIAITEGELDAVILHWEVGIPAVGCPGVQRWQPHFSRCFAGYEAVYVFADGDQPGRDFAKKVANELLQAMAVNLPNGTDVTDIYLSEGPDGLKKRAGL